MSITLIFGPMFSGKTKELMRLAERHILGNENVIMYKYSNDVRYTKGDRKHLISSHDQTTFQAIPVLSFKDTKVPPNTDVVCIDEGQFIEGIVEFCNTIADKGIKVYVSGLSGTYERKPFPRISNLIPFCKTLVHLSAVCISCHKDGHFTRRLPVNGHVSNQIEVIGGNDAYVCCCRRCWNNEIHEHDLNLVKENIERTRVLKKNGDAPK